MGSDAIDAFEEFLVEQVLIGLGNIRASMDRIDTADPAASRLALSRIGAQIDHREARARALHGRYFRSETPAVLLAGAESEPVFYTRRRLN